ncbi:MAG: lysine-N-methylase [Clostridia bacterium]|nr:lysine-N-methylase [Clostridia bacterium]
MKNKPNKYCKLLLPDYLPRFSCITSQCEDICCIGFTVNIDEKTYKKYKKIKNPQLKAKFEKTFARNRSNPGPLKYARIRMDENRSCPFLTEDKLCGLQLQLGEDYLSYICKFYPRTFYKINNLLEVSLTVSCPEAARLVLFNEEKIIFKEILVEKESYLAQGEVMAKKFRFSPEFNKFFNSIRFFLIEILQNRNYRIWERLIILGSFFEHLQTYADQKLYPEAPKLIDYFRQVMAAEKIKESLADLQPQTTMQMILLKLLADVRFFQGISNPRYFQYYTEFLKGINYESVEKEPEIGERYQESYQRYYQPYMENKEYILENYLVNYVFRKLLPLGSGTLFDEYIILVIHYALIKMHLIGLGAFYGNLNDELVLSLIQSFAKSVEHSSTYFVQVRELIKKAELNTLGHMAVLIKN